MDVKDFFGSNGLLMEFWEKVWFMRKSILKVIHYFESNPLLLTLKVWILTFYIFCVLESEFWEKSQILWEKYFESNRSLFKVIDYIKSNRIWVFFWVLKSDLWEENTLKLRLVSKVIDYFKSNKLVWHERRVID